MLERAIHVVGALKQVDFVTAWKTISIALTGAFGVLGLLKDFKNKKTHRVTIWGWVSLGGIIVSSVCGIAAQFKESSDNSARALELAEKTDYTLHEIERALYPLEDPKININFTVPCNNDLLAANFIDDGERIWLIDYELSGNNDPCFELGNIAAESHLSRDGLAELVRSYFGRPRPSRVARAWLLGGLVGMYGWTLWGAIQHGASPIDYDFWGWAMERFEGAARGFTAPDFGQLLDEVQQDD